ncbi:alpha/beta fold hydrolase [Pseudomonas aeruginosa]|uniref:alpha/beta fold hydrolase n=1 Tax=Pseudomonas aeruginosa TaxID=287 RepID=UPI003CFE26B3
MNTDPLLPGFDYLTLHTFAARLRVAVKGSGPPLLLLHGYPQTHLAWHRIAPRLAEDYSVVLADLRGYGESRALDEEGADYSKAALARDQLETMGQLGFERFAVIGHDRGARVGYRLALDHPQAVAAFVSLTVGADPRQLGRGEQGLRPQRLPLVPPRPAVRPAGAPDRRRSGSTSSTTPCDAWPRAATSTTRRRWKVTAGRSATPPCAMRCARTTGPRWASMPTPTRPIATPAGACNARSRCSGRSAPTPPGSIRWKSGRPGPGRSRAQPSAPATCFPRTRRTPCWSTCWGFSPATGRRSDERRRTRSGGAGDALATAGVRGARGDVRLRRRAPSA